MCMMNWLKKLTILRLLILVIYLQNSTITQKLLKMKKNADNGLSNTYITTQEFNRLNFKVIINCSTHWTSAC